jgi:hypothetical protein
MHGLSDRFGASTSAGMPHVDTTNPRSHVASIPRERAVRVGGELFQRVKQECLVPLPRVDAPSLGTHREDVREIGRCRSRETKSRH